MIKDLSRATSFFLFILAGLISANFVSAARSLDVVINEIAWMGTEISYNDEWIELRNKIDSSISLEGWVLKATDGTPEINLTGTILAQGFYLLERTDDNSVPNITADQVYTGALNNNGENLNLYDNLGNLIDAANYQDGWPAGDNSTKQTMERKGVNNWQTSQNPAGTPKAENSLSQREAIEEPKSQTEPQKEEPKIIYPTGVIINEILPSPEGPDSEEEWIEIFNQNSFEIGLFEWQITDVVGKTNLYAFPKGISMQPQEFLVLRRPISKITLNNSGDGLKLSHPDKTIVDTVNYDRASQGESFNRTKAGWVWSSALTPGSANIVPVKQSQLESVATEKSSKQQEKKELAAVGEQIDNLPFSFLTFLVALAVAIFSGIIILILKKKSKIG